jgi:HK97 family phage portal protein
MAVPVNPDEVRVRWNKEQTQRVYEWRDQRMTEGIDFAHIMLPAVTGEPLGLAPLDAGAKMLGYALDQQRYGGEFFDGSAVPAGIVEHPGRLDEQDANNLRARWEAQHQGGRGTAVLSGGVKFSQISINPEQAQFLQTRAFSNQQIATLLGIPPFMLNAGQPQGTASSLTYQNLSQVFEELYRMTLSPVYLTRLEETMQRFIPRGQSVRFDTTELLRTDDANRWAAQKIAIDAGILTADEVREIEGREPLPETEKQGIIDRRAQAAVPPPSSPPEDDEEEPQPDRVEETQDA